MGRVAVASSTGRKRWAGGAFSIAPDDDACDGGAFYHHPARDRFCLISSGVGIAGRLRNGFAAPCASAALCCVSLACCFGTRGRLVGAVGRGHGGLRRVVIRTPRCYEQKARAAPTGDKFSFDPPCATPLEHVARIQSWTETGARTGQNRTRFVPVNLALVLDYKCGSPGRECEWGNSQRLHTRMLDRPNIRPAGVLSGGAGCKRNSAL